jgi:hypothetical protein
LLWWSWGRARAGIIITIERERIEPGGGSHSLLSPHGQFPFVPNGAQTQREKNPKKD